MSFNGGYGVDPATRVKVARAAAEAMLERATRIATYREARDGAQAVIPVDTFRLNLLALIAALDGESRAGQLAIDDEGAGAIAQILHEAEGLATGTFSTEWIETARQVYGHAAMAGRDLERLDRAEPVPRAQHDAVAAAAMMLGELLIRLHRDPANGAGNGAGKSPGNADGQ
jgi:hypothetical protein